MASHQRSAVRCPILLLLAAFGVLALLIPMPVVGQDLYSERIEAANKNPLEQTEENEEALVESLIEIFAGVQAANASPEGKLYRGTHSKGTCAAGTFEVFDQPFQPSPAWE